MTMTADEARKISKTAQQQRMDEANKETRQRAAQLEEEVDKQWPAIVRKLDEQIVDESLAGKRVPKTTLSLDDNSVNQALRSRLVYHYRDLGYDVRMSQEDFNHAIFLTVSW